MRREGLRKDLGFDYAVQRSRRRTLAIHVRPDGSVEVRAPRRLPESVVAAFVTDRRDWVVRKRREVAALPPRFRPLFADGELHPYQGEDYPLTVVPGSRGVSLASGRLRVGVAEPAAEAVARALERWYRRQAETVFSERLTAALERLADWQLPEPRLMIRRMRRRWGSCSSSARVTLNLHLIKTPAAMLDYVIAHELCHLRELNHSPRFYALIDEAMPDWRERQRTLRHYGSRFLG